MDRNIARMMGSYALQLVLGWSICAELLPVPVALAQDSLVRALSVRDSTSTLAELEVLAGGRDALVKQLLELRSDDSRVNVSINAARFLLEFVDRPDVRQAIESDLLSDQRGRVARVVVLNIDRVRSGEFRRRIAELALERAKRETEFLPYARQLKENSDPVVKKLALASFSGE